MSWCPFPAAEPNAPHRAAELHPSGYHRPPMHSQPWCPIHFAELLTCELVHNDSIFDHRFLSTSALVGPNLLHIKVATYSHLLAPYPIVCHTTHLRIMHDSVKPGTTWRRLPFQFSGEGSASCFPNAWHLVSPSPFSMLHLICNMRQHVSPSNAVNLSRALCFSSVPLACRGLQMLSCI